MSWGMTPTKRQREISDLGGHLALTRSIRHQLRNSDISEILDAKISIMLTRAIPERAYRLSHRVIWKAKTRETARRREKSRKVSCRATGGDIEEM